MPLLIPDPPATDANIAASTRRRSLQFHLSSQLDRGFQSERELGVRSFRELPERFSGRESQFLEGPTAAAEVARWRWQVRSNGLLLLERAADLLEVVIRERAEKLLAAGSVAISLQPLSYRAIRQGKPPWRVVIHAPDSLQIDDVFVSSRSFLGIGVYRSAASTFKAFSQCRIGNGGLEGVVGGIVRTNGDFEEEYLATCAHVIRDGCLSLRYPRQPVPADAPDAVLLHPTDCFSSPINDAKEVFPAQDGDTARLQLSHAPLTLHHPNARDSHGWLKYPVGAVLGPTGTLVRFPHYSVQPFRYRIGFLRWPPFRNHFATPGDSGTWVIEKSTRIWLGMVIGGFDHDSDTLVADGQALLDYYSALVRGTVASDRTPNLIPYTWP